MNEWETLGLFLLGGFAYQGLELAWRGQTHWSMFFAGGLCLCMLSWIHANLHAPLLACAVVGALGISAVELGIGLLCNKVWHMHVWDYSGEWGNLDGLVCPKYSALWFLLCLGVLWLMQVLPAMLLGK